jgi:hypothetical protein
MRKRSLFEGDGGLAAAANVLEGGISDVVDMSAALKRGGIGSDSRGGGNGGPQTGTTATVQLPVEPSTAQAAPAALYSVP